MSDSLIKPTNDPSILLNRFKPRCPICAKLLRPVFIRCNIPGWECSITNHTQIRVKSNAAYYTCMKVLVGNYDIDAHRALKEKEEQ